MTLPYINMYPFTPKFRGEFLKGSVSAEGVRCPITGVPPSRWVGGELTGWFSESVSSIMIRFPWSGVNIGVASMQLTSSTWLGCQYVQKNSRIWLRKFSAALEES